MKKGKGDEAPPPGSVNVFEEVAGRIKEQLASYRRESFVVNRELYEGDEAVCIAVEQSVWVCIRLTTGHISVPILLD